MTHLSRSLIQPTTDLIAVTSTIRETRSREYSVNPSTSRFDGNFREQQGVFSIDLGRWTEVNDENTEELAVKSTRNPALCSTMPCSTLPYRCEDLVLIKSAQAIVAKLKFAQLTLMKLASRLARPSWYCFVRIKSPPCITNLPQHSILQGKAALPS